MVARGFYIFLLGVVTFFKRRGYHRGPSKSSRRVLEHDAPYARPSQTRPSYRLTLTLPPPLENTAAYVGKAVIFVNACSSKKSWPKKRNKGGVEGRFER